LTPAKEESSASSFVDNGYPDGMPATYKPVVGSYVRAGTKSKSGMTLMFEVPRGTHQVDLQVAGYPNARGITFKVEGRHGQTHSIVPPLDPGYNWQTVSIKVDPKETAFKIVAKDQSDGAWLAFTMPSVSTDGAPGRWAKSIANAHVYFIDIGMVLLVLGAISTLASASSGAGSYPPKPLAQPTAE
jgi:hypothetical protein